MTEALTILIGAAVPLGSLLLGAWLASEHHRRAIAAITQAQEAERAVVSDQLKHFRALLRDAQNRITAKDLQGYIALRSADEMPRVQYGARSDADEAELEAKRQSILERHKEMLSGV